MGAFENITDKIVLLLQKTMDTLLLDLEKEFSSVRKAIDQLDKSTNGTPSGFIDGVQSAQTIYDNCGQVIKAVFAQVGMDVSQCDNAEKFANLVGKPLAIIDNLATNLEPLTKAGETDYGEILVSLYDTLKDLVQLIKDFQDVEYSKIDDELKTLLGDAYSKFDFKDFAMDILEYIMITILRNGREVFSDEIKYCKLQANEIYKNINDTVKDVRSNVKSIINDLEKDASKAEKMVDSLFKESVEEMEDVYRSLKSLATDTASETASEFKKEIFQLQQSDDYKQAIEIYQKVSGYLAKTYAVLDFLGIVGEKTVEIKLPEKFISALSSAAGEVTGAIGDATDAVSGFVKDITEDANGAVTYVTGNVNKLTGTAKTEIDNAVKKVDSLTGTSLEKLDVTADLVDIPAINIPDYSQQITDIGNSFKNELGGTVQGGIDYLKGISYPIKITTFKWSKIEKMFSNPEDYFKEQYPVNSIEDAENIVSKVIEIVRLFNPDIPDFSSIRNMLESLLRELGEKVLSVAKDARKELWEQVKPLMTMIRKVLDLLEEMYEALKRNSKEIIQEIKRNFIQDVVNPLSRDLKQATDDAEGFVRKVKKQIDSITVPANVEKLYEDIIYPSILDAIKKSKAPDPEKLAAGLKKDSVALLSSWGSGVSTHLQKFFSEKEWKGRLDGTVSALEATFEADVNAVKSFLSPSTLDDFSAIGGKWDDLKDNLDINQYIKIISEAFDNVSVPNPELYYEGFRQCIKAILKKASDAGAKFDDSQITEFLSDIATGVWDRVRNKIINPIIREIKRQVMKIVRRVVREILKRLLDQLPTYIDLSALEGIADNVEKAAATVKVYASEANERIKEVKDLSNAIASGDIDAIADNEFVNAIFTKIDNYIDIPIGKEWAIAAKDIAKASVDFSTSDMGYADVISLVYSLYKAIPKSAKEYFEDILPSIPDDNGILDQFRDFIEGMDYKGDMDDTFAIVTVLNVGSEKDKDGKPAEKKDNGKVDFKASALLQVVIFAGEVPTEEKKEESKEGEDKSGKAGDTQKTDTKSGTSSSGGSKTGDGADAKEAEEEPEAALYCMLIVKGEVGLKFDIGSNHTMSLGVSGGVGGGEVKEINDDNKKKLQQGIGFYITEGWDFNGICNWDALKAMFIMDFQRKNKDGDNSLTVFDTKYISMEIGNYPQAFYLGFDRSYPAAALKDLGLPEQTKKDSGSDSKSNDSGNSLQVGYFGAVQDASVSLHLQDVAFVKEVLKDDIKLGFNTYIWYDYHNGFDFGGDVSLHMDFDLNHKKLGPVTIDSFSLDAGPVEGKKGQLQLVVGTTFKVDFAGALVVAIEDLGVGFKLNYLDEKGSFGDFDLDASISYPSGFGLTVDASVVKGGGVISIDKQTGEFFGVLSLDIMKKIEVGGFLMCDPGTAKGHSFNLIVLLSAKFSPGIPLGMGFSLTAIGGTLGLNRSLSRDAIQNGVRSGSLDQVFFVENIEKHLSEMKTNVVTYFPVKNGQFFFGLLGQISFEPVVKCDFGLLLQLPSPTEIIIVGALKVNAAEGIVRINVYFAGGINFEEGMWFDASIVDSQIVGISISGDMAFRLNWGGKKGFLLSIGGFHPAYKPDEGLHVGKMNRLAMKLDYSILKISFETYMAVTSNSFQIGARFDLKIGWDSFGITGYAGFDALFQFDPFLFMFSVEAGVSVKCGSWTLLSIDLALDVQGPAPWRVAGKAKFKFLLIPIKVSFSKTWGKNAPELPSKLVAIIPLWDEQWERDTNWSIDNSNSSGRPLVETINYESDEMIIQPDGSITFNQSAIPLKTDKLLQKMDMCNDAVPSDYVSLELQNVNGTDVGKGNISMETNDFAPALYKTMSIKDKLSSESYVKYNSGFTANEKEARDVKGNLEVLTRDTQYGMLSLEEAQAEEAAAGVDVSSTNTRILSRSLDSGVSSIGSSIEVNEQNRLSTIASLVEAVEKAKNGSSIEINEQNRLSMIASLVEAVEKAKNGSSSSVRLKKTDAEKTVSPNSERISKMVSTEKLKQKVVEEKISGKLDLSGRRPVATKPIKVKPIKDSGSISVKPGQSINLDENKPGTVLRPTERKIKGLTGSMPSNNRKDRVSFDRYIAALDAKCNNKK